MLPKGCQRIFNWFSKASLDRGNLPCPGDEADEEKQDESGLGKSDPVWCLVANVKEAREYGEEKEVRSGTKHFPPGAKVYCFPGQWGDGYSNVKVVGRHRGSHQYVTMIVRSEHLNNWRAKLVYSPEVIRRLAGAWDASARSKEEAERYVSWMQRRECGEEEKAQGARDADPGALSFIEKLLRFFPRT